MVVMKEAIMLLLLSEAMECFFCLPLRVACGNVVSMRALVKDIAVYQTRWGDVVDGSAVARPGAKPRPRKKNEEKESISW
jgi:hypothetical protein